MSGYAFITSTINATPANYYDTHVTHDTNDARYQPATQSQLPPPTPIARPSALYTPTGYTPAPTAQDATISPVSKLHQKNYSNPCIPLDTDQPRTAEEAGSRCDGRSRWRRKTYHTNDDDDDIDGQRRW